MKKNFTLFKTLLVAVGLCTGVSAWAGEQIIFSQNCETWTSTSIGDYVKSASLQSGVSLSTADGYGNFAQFSVGSNNGRTFYYRWYTTGNDNYGEQKAYTVEFDASIATSSANKNGQAGTELVVVADGGNFPTNNNNAYSTTTYLFKIKQTVALQQTFQINDTGDALTNYPNGWLHYKLEVDGDDGIVAYTITNGSTTVASGTRTLPDGVSYKAQGFSCLASRYNTVMKFDNIKVFYETTEDVANAPTITLTGINGIERTYMISFTEGETLHYTLPGGTEQIVASGTSVSVTATASGTLSAYTTNGTATSSMVNETVDASAVTLAAPRIWVSGMIANGDFYNATLNADNSQASVLLTPTATQTATFTPDGGTATAVTLPYTATEKGTLTVTVSATGYTSASTLFAIEQAYSQTWQSLDFSSLIGLESVQAALDNTWTQQDGHGRWASWKDQTYNFYQQGTASGANVTINDNIYMRNVVLLAEGLGLGRNVTGGEAISISNTTAGQIVGFEIYNGYGNNINKGTNTYMSYAVSDGTTRPSMTSSNGALLVQATIYSVAPTSVSKSISAAGWATYCSPYALDFTNEIEHLEAAYIVTGAHSDQLTDDELTLEEVEGTVPANTGLLLKGVGECVIPVVASGNATNVSDNVLVGVTAEEEKDAKSIWVLMNGDNGVGFYYNNNPFTVSANTAYIPATATNFAIPTTGTKARFFSIDGNNATAIKSVESEKAENGVMYNLAGQRVGKDYKGIVIVNGKKFNN